MAVRDDDIFKMKLGRTGTVDRRVTARTDAGTLRIDEEEGDPLPILHTAEGPCGHYKMSGPWCVAHDCLISVEQIRCAVLRRIRAYSGNFFVTARLAMRERQQGVAGNGGTDHGRRDCGVRPFEDTASDDHRLEVGLHEQRLAELFHDDHNIDGTPSRSANGFVERYPENAELCAQHLP